MKDLIRWPNLYISLKLCLTFANSVKEKQKNHINTSDKAQNVIFLWTGSGVDSHKFTVLSFRYTFLCLLNITMTFFPCHITSFYCVCNCCSSNPGSDYTVNSGCLPTVSESYLVEYQLAVQSVTALNEVWQTLYQKNKTLFTYSKCF